MFQLNARIYCNTVEQVQRVRRSHVNLHLSAHTMARLDNSETFISDFSQTKKTSFCDDLIGHVPSEAVEVLPFSPKDKAIAEYTSLHWVCVQST